MKSDHLLFFLELLILLAGSRLLGGLFRAMRQPAVVGELLAGIFLGPSFLGSLKPDLYARLFPTPQGHPLPAPLDAFTILGVTLLMLSAGLEVDLSLLLRQKKVTALCAFFGSVVPLALGAAAGWLFAASRGMTSEKSLVFALFIGINLAMSALPVIAKTLLDLGIYRTRVGAVILSAALADDLAVWLIFCLIIGFSGGSGAEGTTVGMTALLTTLMLIGALTVGRAAVRRALSCFEARSASAGTIVAFIVASGLAMACFAMWIGVHPVFGSLLAGVAIGSAPELRPRAKEVVYEFVISIFAPIFFASIGLRTNFVTNFDTPLVLAVFVLGCLGKLVGAGLGARLGGFAWREACAVAVGLNSRGIMGIVLGVVALEYKIIDERMFVAVSVLGIATSLISGPLLRYTLGAKYFSEAPREKSQSAT